jgi:hypothetical protein
MTSQSPRIYLYKITFEEVSYYYYGVHKERKYDEYYMGTPITHKWCWNFYTPKKQILEIFDYTDEGWLEANKVEQRLIKPAYQTDEWCLNENCGGVISLNISKINGKKTKELNIGIFSRTEEQKKEDRSKGGRVGGKNGGEKVKELKIGIFNRSEEKRILDSRNGALVLKQLNLGICSLTYEQLSENGKRGGKIAAKKLNSQKWMCLETGFISTSAGLSHYQKKRGVDTSKRKRVS